MKRQTLAVIPARGGSKGIPGKNIKPLAGKPLLHYSIDVARAFLADEDICVSTDAEEIVRCAGACGLDVPFMRPADLATDEASTYDVLLHTLKAYEAMGIEYEDLLLLQPTSPLRSVSDVSRAMALFHTAGVEMVVSVMESSANPYYTLFEEDNMGFLRQSKEANFTRRQDCPPVYQYNGAIYLLKVDALKRRPLNQFEKVVKFVMEPERSVDLDSPLDWEFAEFLLDRTSRPSK
jgi:N-acylneuraminate cytidylyltransferase